MTKINKLMLRGFKSFAKKTEILFGGDFNCVVGPNGSGKSNILDALCFVLGRSSTKALRAEKSANLIYNGGKSKKGMDEGEVSIWFDNSKNIFPTEDKEVKLSRIVRKNGQSIYKINDKRRTRQQILDLMSVAKVDPEGYNIILQGDIVKFVEMSPIERRQIIEEISGISVYEEKKQKALRELEKVDEKLKEAEIILAERNTHLKELKKDRDQALKYKELKDNIDENKASYLHIKVEKKDKERAGLQEKIDENQKKLDIVNNRTKKFKDEIQEKKKEIDDITKEIEEKGEKEQVALHKQIEGLKVSIATNKTRIESCRGEIVKINQRVKQLKNDLKEHDVQVSELKNKKEEVVNEKASKLEEVSRIEAQIKKFREKNELDNVSEIEKSIEDIDQALEEKQKEINSVREKQQELLREKDRIEFQIQSTDERISKVLEVEKEHQQQIEELKKKKDKFKNATLKLNKSLNEDSSLAAQLGDARKKISESQEELSKLKIRSVGIREGIAGNKAVKKILDSGFGGIYGTVAKLGNVGSKYSLALEVAAGNRLKSVVVEDDETAAKCIKYLKENKFGVVSFVPLNKVKTVEVNKEVKKLIGSNGVHDFALKLVSFEPKFKKVFSWVFGNTIVVDNIDTARRVGIGKAKMVTLDGDLTDLSGVMRGGYREKKREGIGFQEKELFNNITEHENIVNELKNTIDTLEKTRIENEEDINKLREKKAVLEGEIIKSEKSLHLESGDVEASKQQKESLTSEINGINDELNKLQEEISELNKDFADSKIKKEELKGRVSKLRNPTLVAELNAFEEEKGKLKESLVEAGSDVKNIDLRIEMNSNEKEKINDILKKHGKEIEDFDEEIKKLDELIFEEEKTLKENEKNEKEFRAKFKNLFDERGKVNDIIQKNDSKIESLQEQSRKVEITMNTDSLENAKIKAELAGLQQEFEQYRGVKINKEKSEEELRQGINKFERMVQDMGNINLRALEVYEEVEKEYNSLLEKKGKLDSEKVDVVGMIDEIEGKKKELFLNTLDVINTNFQGIFSSLTAKGEAGLELENTENPFEAGLRVRVRVTGTKFLDIRSLSGGEKTLTALAFIFSIQEHSPASFYILDEVDAALDKHNSDKLAKLIRKYVDKAQYIMISHNDGIITEANNLYGISMDEHGMSKVTSLKI